MTPAQIVGAWFVASIAVLGCASTAPADDAAGTGDASGSGSTTGVSDPDDDAGSPSTGAADGTTPGASTGDSDTSGTTITTADTATATATDGDEDSSSGGPSSGDCTPFPSAADFAAPGPFTAASSAEGPECTIFRPTVLGEEDRLHPIVVWGNGTATLPSFYEGILSHWATHGMVVAAANTSDAGSGTEMIACLDYLQAQNDTPGSVYEGVLDLAHVATTGHSQGGGGAIMAGRDARVVATAPVQPYTQQGFGGYDQAAQSEQAGPMFLLSGANDEIAAPVPNQQRVWDTINGPIFWGTKAGVSHVFGVLGPMDAFRREITAWLRYQLMCDEEAGTLFVEPCTLCTDPEWTVQSMGL